MNKILIIARMTFREAIRRRIVLTGLVLGVLFLVIFSIGFHMIYTEITAENSWRANAMSRVMQAEASNFLMMAGVYAVAFLSVAMGALLSADTLAGEINSGKEDITVPTLEFPGKEKVFKPSTVPGIPYLPSPEKLEKFTKHKLVLEK